MREINDITNLIIGAAIRVHTELGPGLLESAYQQCLAYEIEEAGLKVEREKPMPLIYKNVKMDCGYRIDLLVEDRVIVELKAVEELTDAHIAQTLTYLKLANEKVGLLINFNVYRLKDGIRRLINKYYDESMHKNIK